MLTLNLETVTLPNGRVAELEIAHHPGGAAIVVALDAAGRVCLLHQFRHAAGGWLDRDCRPASSTAASRRSSARVRELAEEAGMTAGRWDKLGEYFSSPGVLTEVIHVFLARDLAPSAAAPEEHEVFEVALGAAGGGRGPGRGGEIRDGKSLVGLLWAAQRWLAGAGAGSRAAPHIP